MDSLYCAYKPLTSPAALPFSHPRAIRTYLRPSKLRVVLVLKVDSVLAATWGVMFIFDGAVFVLTFGQAICVHRGWSRSMATLMLKDGKYRAIFLPVYPGL